MEIPLHEHDHDPEAREFEGELQKYPERSEEGRAVRVGEKETSEQAAIVAKYASLFSRDQLDALREAEAAASGEERERLYRLRKTCEGGIVAAELAEREDALENAILAARVTWGGDELPLRAAQAKLAVLPEYREREELGALQASKSAEFNDDRLELIRAGEELEAELSGEPVARAEEEKQISLRELEQALAAASDAIGERWSQLREKWFDRLLGAERADVPEHAHVAWIRRLSPLEATYTKERSVEVCMSTLTDLGFDLENDRNVGSTSRMAAEVAARLRDRLGPPKVVHLITRAQEAARLPGVPARGRACAALRRRRPVAPVHLSAHRARPRADRDLLVHPRGDHARAGMAPATSASATTRRENAEATTFLEAFLYRRYVAKLQYELGFWSLRRRRRHPEGYEEKLTAATGIRYRRDNYLADMDAGFYSADYLRAWIRHAQLREYLKREVGEDWWRSSATGDRLRDLFREGRSRRPRRSRSVSGSSRWTRVRSSPS